MKSSWQNMNDGIGYEAHSFSQIADHINKHL